MSTLKLREALSGGEYATGGREFLGHLGVCSENLFNAAAVQRFAKRVDLCWIKEPGPVLPVRRRSAARTKP